MANSLQDQLVKAGLADAVQAEKSRPKSPSKSRRKPQSNAKPKPKAKPKTQGDPARRTAVPKRQPAKPRSPEDAALAQERRELRIMEQQRKQQEKTALQAERDKQQRRQRLRDFLLREQKNDRAGEIPFNFTADKRIRRLYVTPQQRDALRKGELLIAVLGKRDFIIDPDQLAQVRDMDPQLFIYNGAEQQDSGPADDDPYKDYAVPDDLTW